MGKIWQELLLLLGRQEALHHVGSGLGRSSDAAAFVAFDYETFINKLFKLVLIQIFLWARSSAWLDREVITLAQSDGLI